MGANGRGGREQAGGRGYQGRWTPHTGHLKHQKRQHVFVRSKAKKASTAFYTMLREMCNLISKHCILKSAIIYLLQVSFREKQRWRTLRRKSENSVLDPVFATITEIRRLSGLERKENYLTYACGGSGVQDWGYIPSGDLVSASQGEVSGCRGREREGGGREEGRRRGGGKEWGGSGGGETDTEAPCLQDLS